MPHHCVALGQVIERTASRRGPGDWMLVIRLIFMRELPVAGN